MKNHLKTLRILDQDGTVSLTSLLQYAVMGKFIVAPSIEVTLLLALISSLANSNLKKWFIKLGADKVIKDKQEFEQLKKDIASVKNAMTMRM